MIVPIRFVAFSIFYLLYIYVFLLAHAGPLVSLFIWLYGCIAFYPTCTRLASKVVGQRRFYKINIEVEEIFETPANQVDRIPRPRVIITLAINVFMNSLTMRVVDILSWYFWNFILTHDF